MYSLKGVRDGSGNGGIYGQKFNRGPCRIRYLSAFSDFLALSHRQCHFAIKLRRLLVTVLFFYFPISYIMMTWDLKIGH